MRLRDGEFGSDNRRNRAGSQRNRAESGSAQCTSASWADPTCPKAYRNYEHFVNRTPIPAIPGDSAAIPRDSYPALTMLMPGRTAVAFLVPRAATVQLRPLAFAR